MQPLKKTKKLLLGPDLGARKKFECPVKNHVNRSLQLNRLLKDYFKTMRTLYLVLILALASVRSEYTWNGQEWVWSEDKNVGGFFLIFDVIDRDSLRFAEA